MHQLMMNVIEFHRKMGQPIGDPRDPDITVEQDFRMSLIDEELLELRHALAGYYRDSEGHLVAYATKEEQIAAVADGLGDLSYVIAGSAVSWGLDLGTVLDAIHASNMTKRLNPHGKSIKGPEFRPVDLVGTLAEVKAEFEANPDFIGDDEGAYWPTPSKTRSSVAR